MHRSPASDTDLTPARLWRQLAAIVYDGLLVLALMMVLTGLVFAARGGNDFNPASIWYRLALVVTVWAYYVWSWTHGGQTVGMRAWRIALSDNRGDPVNLVRASLRFVAAWISALPAGLGYLSSLVDPAGKTWHDRLSGTRLEHRPKSAQP